MSTLRFGGVAAILEELRGEVSVEMHKRLHERRNMGYLEISDEEIESISRIAGMIARTKGADAIGEAFQLGVNKAAKEEDHDRPTTPVPGTLKRK